MELQDVYTTLLQWYREIDDNYLKNTDDRYYLYHDAVAFHLKDDVMIVEIESDYQLENFIPIAYTDIIDIKKVNTDYAEVQITLLINSVYRTYKFRQYA